MPARRTITEPVRVAVVDDDEWRRFAMAELLDGSPAIDVVHALGQDEAVAWPHDRWRSIAVALVDTYDDRAPGQVGTDLFAGISAVETLRPLPVHVLALTPYSCHPLVQLRLAQAKPEWTYHRWEVPTLDALSAALLDPDPQHVAVKPTAPTLEPFGAQRALANEAVRVYLRSKLAGCLRPALGHKGIPASRRTVDRFRRAIAATGFSGTEYLSGLDAAYRAPRWPDTRDYLLRLIGRLDAPPSEHDRPWLTAR